MGASKPKGKQKGQALKAPYVLVIVVTALALGAMLLSSRSESFSSGSIVWPRSPLQLLSTTSCKNIDRGHFPEGWEHSRYVLVPTKTEPPYFISLHSIDFDQHRWGIFRHGVYYEHALTAITKKVLSHNDNPGVVVDVGANIGWFGLYAAAMGHQVVMFEPNPFNQKRLCESVAVNGFVSRATVVPRAVSNAPSDAYLMWGSNPGGARILSPQQAERFIQGGNASHPKTAEGVRLVPTHITTLDDYFEQAGWRDVKLMKVDVEGFEPMVLAGAWRLMRRCNVRTVYMEISPHFKGAVSIAEVIEKLVALGYKLEDIDPPTDRNATAKGDDILEQFQFDSNPTPILSYCSVTAGKQCNLFWVNSVKKPRCR